MTPAQRLKGWLGLDSWAAVHHTSPTEADILGARRPSVPRAALVSAFLAVCIYRQLRSRKPDNGGQCHLMVQVHNFLPPIMPPPDYLKPRAWPVWVYGLGLLALLGAYTAAVVMIHAGIGTP